MGGVRKLQVYLIAGSKLPVWENGYQASRRHADAVGGNTCGNKAVTAIHRQLHALERFLLRLCSEAGRSTA